MSSRIGVMNTGHIRQIGTPVDIYEYPTSRFVADFIGAANMFDGTVTGGGDGRLTVACPELGHDIAVDYSGALAAGAPVTVMVRPEKMAVSRERPVEGMNWTEGGIADMAYLGDVSVYHVRLESGHKIEVLRTNLRHSGDRPPDWDDRVFVSWHPANALVLTR